MASASAKSNPHRARKRVEADAISLKRARDGSAFTRCDACHKDVPVVLIDMHSCSLDSKIRMHLESQVIEKETEMKKKPVERKRATSTGGKERKGKKGTNSNKPKRPLTAFFLFMEDFRKEYKEANADAKGVTTVTKEGGVKWRSMTDEEKKVYSDRAAELKAEYVKDLEKCDNGYDEDKEGSEMEEEKVEENKGSDNEEEVEENKGSDKEEDVEEKEGFDKVED